MTPSTARQVRSPARPRGGDERPSAAPDSIQAIAALPDPPLADPRAQILLRRWTLTDVAALVAAWADPALAAANGVPDDVSVASATRWIRGEPARRAAGACLDLVIGPSDGGPTVLGEVGLRNIERGRRRAEISWWVAAEHRGHGLATEAARLLADWALSDQGGLDQVWARIDSGNTASSRVASSVGLAELGAADGTIVWARTRRRHHG
jgi:RimJ/RimL family protein N-acetyltransferase